MAFARLVQTVKRIQEKNLNWIWCNRTFFVNVLYVWGYRFILFFLKFNRSVQWQTENVEHVFFFAFACSGALFFRWFCSWHRHNIVIYDKFLYYYFFAHCSARYSFIISIGNMVMRLEHHLMVKCFVFLLEMSHNKQCRCRCRYVQYVDGIVYKRYISVW